MVAFVSGLVWVVFDGILLDSVDSYFYMQNTLRTLLRVVAIFSKMKTEVKYQSPCNVFRYLCVLSNILVVVRVAHFLFYFLCCIFCFVYLRSVTCA